MSSERSEQTSAEDAVREQVEGVHITDLRPLLVDPAKLSILLGLSESTVYELLNTGEIPSFKVGRRRVIPVAAIEKWIADKLEAEGTGQ